MTRWKIGVFMLAILASASALATTWASKEIDDPLKPGAKCKVQEPASFGSYIYMWPSKYDQVFWPLTDPDGIWFCPESGFTAFLTDNDGLTAAQRTAIRTRIAPLYTAGKGEPSEAKILELLEANYDARGRDAVFNNRTWRVLAYRYEQLGDVARATRYRKRALDDIHARLPDASMSVAQRIEYLFLCAAYHAEFGEADAAAECRRQLDAALATVNDPATKGFADYIVSLKPDLARITPGGTLAPKE